MDLVAQPPFGANAEAVADNEHPDHQLRIDRRATRLAISPESFSRRQGPTIVGVDISKDTLDVAIHPGGESFRITNNPEGHRALIKRLKGFVSPLIKRQLAQRLRQIDGQIEAIDRRLKTLRNADSDLCQRFDILTSIPGVGEVTANVLVVETPELGRLEHAQAASLVGLAPVPRDSGQTYGKRSIRGGRPRARQALYMPALNAIRLNPEFKAKYEAMVKAGKPAKVAIVAIMRKLLILANALIRDQRKWAPAKT